MYISQGAKNIYNDLLVTFSLTIVCLKRFMKKMELLA